MKAVITSILLVLAFSLQAQIDINNNTPQFESIETLDETPTGLEFPQRKTPGLSIPKDERTPKSDIKLGENEPEPADITKGDGLLEYKSGSAPKYFKKDKGIKEEYKKDQFLGEVKTGTAFVHVKYRDHESVDGDRIRVYVNDDIVQSNVSLHGSFGGFMLNLVEGYNTIVFEALNQGKSGPNTAELHVYDDNQMLISAGEWNLTTGAKASVIVIKE